MFTQPKVLLPSTQEPAIGPCRQPDKFHLQPSTFINIFFPSVSILPNLFVIHSGIYSSGYQTVILYTFLMSPVRAK